MEYMLLEDGTSFFTHPNDVWTALFQRLFLLLEKFCFLDIMYSIVAVNKYAAAIYLFNINFFKGHTRTMFEICLKLTMKTSMVFLLLTLNRFQTF